MSSTICCRICHEEEFEDSQTLDAPCACSGTSKFAHRTCIQRWCDEKGNTICEICLQSYRPGYTATPEIEQVLEPDEVIPREIPLPNWDEQNMANPREEEGTLGAMLLATEVSDSSLDGPTSCCKSFSMIFIVLLLGKHMFVVVVGEVGKLLYMFWKFIIKSCGFIIAMYLIMWMTKTIIQEYQDRQRHERLQLIRYNRTHVNEQLVGITVDP